MSINTTAPLPLPRLSFQSANFDEACSTVGILCSTVERGSSLRAGRGEVLQNVRIGCGLLQNLFSKRVKKGTIKKKFKEVVNNLWLAENQMDYKIELNFQKINRYPGERGGRWFSSCSEGFGARRRREGWRGGAAALWTPFESMKTRNSPSPCSPLLNHSEWNTFG